MTPMEDFEHQLLLSTFSFASHSLRLLANAGMIDEQAALVIRHHLQFLEKKIEALPEPQLRDFFHQYLDTLIGVLPPTSGDGSQDAG